MEVGEPIVFSGPNAVGKYRALVIAYGLDLYARSGLLPNRAYKPNAMMKAATQITGRQFKARAYTEAATALREWVQNQEQPVVN